MLCSSIALVAGCASYSCTYSPTRRPQWFCCEAFNSPLAQAWAKANLKLDLTEMSCDVTTDEGRASAIRCLKWVAGGCKGYYERMPGKERYRPKVLVSLMSQRILFVSVN